MNAWKVGLGDAVRDRISGLTGIVTGRADYLFGCKQVLISGRKIGADGKLPEGVWLDEDRVSIEEAGKIPAPETAADRAGGPSQGPQRF